MMRNFFENRLAFAATVLAFAGAMMMGGGSGNGGTSMSLPDLPVQIADGPILPPDPWCPACPPSGELSLVAESHDGPILPPDPWCPACPPPDGAIHALLLTRVTNGGPSLILEAPTLVVRRTHLPEFVSAG